MSVAIGKDRVLSILSHISEDSLHLEAYREGAKVGVRNILSQAVVIELWPARPCAATDKRVTAVSRTFP